MDRQYFRSEQSVTFCTFYIRYGLMESGSVPIQWEYYGESRNFDLSPSPPPPWREYQSIQASPNTLP